MRKLQIQFIFTFLFLFLFQSAFAASPMGYWKTIDDRTGRAKGIIKISGSPSYLRGTVVKIFPGALTICTACHGNLKNKPIMGMTIMYGLRMNPRNPNEWTGGTIFDPKNGQAYRATLVVSPDGRTMNVRGYVGVSLFGRTQTWVRVGK